MISSFSKPFWLGLVTGVIATLLLGGVLWALQEVEQTGSVTSPSSLKQKLAITYQNGLLSVDLKDADLKDVLEEVARQTGIKVSVSPEVKKQVSATFTNLEPSTALERLLGSSNYFLVFRRTFATETNLPSEIQVLSPQDLARSDSGTSLGRIYEVKDSRLRRFTINYPADTSISLAQWDSEGTNSESFEIQFDLPGSYPVGFSVHQNTKGLSVEDWVTSDLQMKGEDSINTVKTVWKSFSINGYPAYAVYSSAAGYAGNELTVYLSDGKFMYAVTEHPGEDPASLDNSLPYQQLSSLHFMD